MNSMNKEVRGSTFDSIVTVLCTPITWSMIAEKLGVTVKASLVSANSVSKGILSVSGEIKYGVEAKYRIEEVDFDVTPNTCVVGDLIVGVPAKAKIALSQGKKPTAISVVMLSDRFKH